MIDRNRLKGTGVAVITPFGNDGSLDEKGLEKIINNLIFGGVEYLVFLGTTAESVTLTKQEKKRVFSLAVEVVDGRVPVVAGIGGNNTAEVLETIAETDFNGIDAILSVSPYYNKPSQEGIYQHYMAIAAKAPVPVILYNVPGRTMSNMTAETTLRLARDCSNIIGIKEASGNFDQCMQILTGKPENFLVISGDDNITLPLMSLGMDGVISVIANAYPATFSGMVRDCLNGRFDEAREKHYSLLPSMNLIFAEGNPTGIKALMHSLKVCGPDLRLPLVKASKGLSEKIDAFVLQNGSLK